jgi:hypothetical protein
MKRIITHPLTIAAALIASPLLVIAWAVVSMAVWG